MSRTQRFVTAAAAASVLLGAGACGTAPTPRGGAAQPPSSPVTAAPSVGATGDPSATPSAAAGLGRRPEVARRRSGAAGPTAVPRQISGGTAVRTAAARYGWRNLVARDDFTGSVLNQSWGAYESPGNDGKGVRSPRRITLNHGILRMTGTSDGTTAGMTWSHPQKYGRWEIRARFPAGCGCYHPVLILWPTEHPWPAGGELDYAEVFDGGRQKLNFFMHYGADNRQDWGGRRIDMTRWHTFAVEWTPDHIVGFVDGEPFFRNTQSDIHPPGPMNQTIQLDWFPGEGHGGGTLEVDWATIYRL
jgi:hypothetical protein